MKAIHFVLPAILLCICPGNALAQFDAKQCQRIDQVEIPYDVTLESGSVTFSTQNDRIVVSEARIEAGGKTLSGPQVGRYYGDVRRFLDRARTMANVALPFSGEQTTMGAAATQMCMAILDMAASNAVVERAFPGFVSPVRVKLR